MDASVEQQQGPHSPKQVNGSAVTSPLKHSPDSVQNSSSNLSTHIKGRKIERGEQSVDAVKREQSLRPGDGDSGQLRSESLFNLEIAKFSEKGGLMDSDAVERLVQLMQPEKSEKKIDLTGRSMLASIIAATDKLDCLNQFVQLRGLFVLIEWLEEFHKGKVGDLGNHKSSDKSVDDFLLVLLRALDKLPVNLLALQMCNIGKSVNHLRSHKNSEIQRKARSLVDTWKKRVEAEMNINESQRTCEIRRLPTVSEILCSPSINEIKSRYDSFVSSMNALIESYAKNSEADVSISAGDDVGMNLFASVATREISKSGTVSPAVSPHENSEVTENPFGNYVRNHKQLPGDDDAIQESGQSTEVAGECSKQCDTKNENLPQVADDFLKSNGISDAKVVIASPPASLACTIGRSIGYLGANPVNKKVIDAKVETENEPPIASQGCGGSSEAEDKVKVASLNDNVEKKGHQGTASCPLNGDDEKSSANQGLQSNIALEQNSVDIALQSGPMHTNENAAMISCGTSRHLAGVNSNDVKSEKTYGVDVSDLAGQAGNRILDKEKDTSFVPSKPGEHRVSCADLYQDRGCNDQKLETKEVTTQMSSSSDTK